MPIWSHGGVGDLESILPKYQLYSWISSWVWLTDRVFPVVGQDTEASVLISYPSLQQPREEGPLVQLVFTEIGTTRERRGWPFRGERSWVGAAEVKSKRNARTERQAKDIMAMMGVLEDTRCIIGRRKEYYGCRKMGIRISPPTTEILIPSGWLTHHVHYREDPQTNSHASSSKARGNIARRRDSRTITVAWEAKKVHRGVVSIE